MTTNKKKYQKYRVWWIPQVGIWKTFFVPVESPEEGQKIIDLLSAYDCFEYNQRVKPDYCNTGGLQMFDENKNEWVDWYYEDDTSYYDSDELDEFCEHSSHAKELEEFRQNVFSQVNFNQN